MCTNLYGEYIVVILNDILNIAKTQSFLRKLRADKHKERRNHNAFQRSLKMFKVT